MYQDTVSSWEWAREAWQKGFPEDLPNYTGWDKATWEQWLEGATRQIQITSGLSPEESDISHQDVWLDEDVPSHTYQLRKRRRLLHTKERAHSSDDSSEV
jgi:hypothetical protein